jgi:hypothetical protein
MTNLAVHQLILVLMMGKRNGSAVATREFDISGALVLIRGTA